MDVNQITTITLPGIVFLGACLFFMFSLSRERLAVPILLASCYMTYGQAIVIAGINLTILRILILAFWLRTWIKGEFFFHKFNKLDKAVLAWAFCSLVIGSILYHSFGGFVNRMGFVYDLLGTYWMFKFIFKDYDSIEYTLKIIAILIIPLASLMIIESVTGRNLFSFLGGVPEFSKIRDGMVRAQGPFRHPILAGTFAATTFPILFALHKIPRNRNLLTKAAIISCFIIIFTTNSSGPIMSLFFSVTGLAFWVFRDHMKEVRWGLVFSLLGLQIFMKAPIWYLMAKVGNLIGGGGWHRAYLVDQAIKHFDEWWLVGSTYTAHWMPYHLGRFPNMVDITNTYISVGLNGGVITLTVFILVIIRCFQGLGKSQKIIPDNALGQRFFIWAIGAALFSHVVSLFSVTYFDQIFIFWYMLIAMISSISDFHASTEST